MSKDPGVKGMMDGGVRSLVSWSNGPIIVGTIMHFPRNSGFKAVGPVYHAN